LLPLATTVASELTGTLGSNGNTALVGVQGSLRSATAITAQLIAADGTLKGTLADTGRQGSHPSVACDGTRYLLVWQDDTTTSGVIYGQFFGLDGTSDGTPFRIGPVSGGQLLDGTAPVVFDGTNYFICWRSAINGALSGQFLTPAGAPRGAALTLATRSARNYAVATNGTRLQVNWLAAISGGAAETYDLESCALGKDGTLSAAVRLNAARSYANGPFSLIAVGARFFAVWYSSPLIDSTGGGLRARFIAASGAVDGAELTPVFNADQLAQPLAAFDGTRILLAWTNNLMAGRGVTLNGQWLSPTGNTQGAPFTIAAATGGKMPVGGSVSLTPSGYLVAVTLARVMVGLLPDPSAFLSADVYTTTIARPPAPDLVVSSMVASRTALRPGDRVNVTVTVKNQGTAAAGIFALDFYANRATAPASGDSGDLRKQFPGLGAGMVTTYTFTDVTYPFEGDARLWAVVDRDGAIDEWNENNNVAGPLTLVVHLPRPDLIISRLLVTPSVGLPGDPFSVSLTVHNQGDLTANTFLVSLYTNVATAPDGQTPSDQELSVPILAPGASTTLSFSDVRYDQEGAKQLWALVNRDGYIDEARNDNNSAGPIALTVRLLRPDLTITSLKLSRTAAAPGDLLSATIVVKNQGLLTAHGMLKLFQNRPTAPAFTDLGETNAVLEAIAPNASLTYTVPNIRYTEEGISKLWAAVANMDSIDEARVDNNISGPVAVTIHQARPDLTISSFTVTPTQLAPGATCTATVVVKNLGDAPSPATVSLYANRSSAPLPTDAGNISQSVVNVAAGASATLTIRGLSYLADGDYHLWAAVRGTGVVGESVTENNAAGPRAMTVRTPRPDLIISRLTAGKTVLGVNEAMTVTAIVQNTGKATSTACTLGLYLTHAPGGAADMIATVPAVRAGASATVTLANVRFTAAGKYALQAAVDLGNAVTELREDNNTAGPVNIAVGSDLYIVSASANKTALLRNEVFTITAQVRNLGALSTPCQLGLYLQNTAPTAQDTPVRQLPIKALTSGSSVSLTFSALSFATPGTYTYYLRVDSQGQLAEVSTLNNNSVPVVVTVSATPTPDLTIVSVTPSKTTASLNAAFNVVIAVKNQGNAPSAACTLGLYDTHEPQVGSPSDYLLPVPALAVGKTATFTIKNVRLATPGLIPLWAFIDSGNIVAESREDNNLAAPVAVTVTADASYWPLSPGSFWTLSNGTSTQTLSVAAPVTFANHPAFPLTTVIDAQSQGTLLLNWESDWLQVYGVAGIASPLTFTPPAQLLPWAPRAGSRWTITNQGNTQIPRYARVVGFATVDTPAGSFVNCLAIFQYSDAANPDVGTYLYLAPGVGVVKAQRAFGATPYLLVAYRIGPG
jgi:subtilase family serine protease